MSIVLWILAVHGLIGAFDTLYYHEWRARLPARPSEVRAELWLHAARDYVYAVIFATLPWVAWYGVWALALAALLGAEIVITLQDFAIEARARRSLGDVYAGERMTHAVMAILYGAMLALLVPVLWEWGQQPTGLVVAPPSIPAWLQWGLALMAVGVFVSGLRDGYAALGLRNGGWPWTTEAYRSERRLVDPRT
jgi:hypothetical protein